MKLKRRFRSISFILLLILGIGMTFSPINAQYFGGNKVQYESFDFKIMRTEHFDIYFYPEKEEAAQQAARPVAASTTTKAAAAPT